MRTKTLKLALAACSATAVLLAGCRESADIRRDTAGSKPPVQQAAQTAAPNPQNAPKIVAVKAIHDAGKVKQGESIEHIFKIRNKGKVALKLERAKGS